MFAKLFMAPAFAGTQASHFNNLLRGQLGSWVTLTSKRIASFSPNPFKRLYLRTHATLPDRIHRVILGRPNHQMVRVDTRAIVSTRTIMKHVHSLWNWSVSKFPGKPVSVSMSSVPTKLAVSGSHDRCLPNPAAARCLLNEVPKSFFGSPSVSLNRNEKSPVIRSRKPPVGWHPSSLKAVRCVHLGQSSKQVVRIAARRIVASVTNVVTVWNRTVRQLVGEPMREHLPSTDRQHSVAVWHDRSREHPATGRGVLVNTRPESVDCFLVHEPQLA